MSAQKILLLSEGRFNSNETRTLLQILGYRVEVFQDLELALQHYENVLETEEQFDLVLADVTPGRARYLEQMHLEGRIGRLILLQAELFCRDYYCISGRIGVVCNLSALLKCMLKILPEPAEIEFVDEAIATADIFVPQYRACA